YGEDFDHTPSTARYSRTTVASPTKTAREMIAWPIETSSRKGKSRNTVRLARSRSWPALMPRPSEWASSAASTNVANDWRPLSAPRSNARAYGSVYNSMRSAPVDAAQRIASGWASTNRLTRVLCACRRLTTSGIRADTSPDVPAVALAEGLPAVALAEAGCQPA